VAVRWRRAADERGVELVVEAPASGTLEAGPHLLRRVLDNLLDNAVRHSPDVGRVVLAARRDGGGWLFEVADQGTGVSPELRGRIFERFARADPARSRSSGGAGLGLALSAAVARSHGGSLELLDDGRPGATFRLRLP
jgi:signal transduction histidine kinase